MIKSRSEGMTRMTEDEVFFKTHPRRFFRIRDPRDDREFSREFSTLGDHQIDRRAVIVVRTFTGIIHIPFLKFADESIEDSDAVLKPIVDEMMGEARDKYRRMN
jgi:hypothetical protein